MLSAFCLLLLSEEPVCFFMATLISASCLLHSFILSSITLDCVPNYVSEFTLADVSWSVGTFALAGSFFLVPNSLFIKILNIAITAY
jgi:hypothetical protein